MVETYSEYHYIINKMIIFYVMLQVMAYLLQRSIIREAAYLNTIENLALNLLGKKEKINMLNKLEEENMHCYMYCFINTMRRSCSGYLFYTNFLKIIGFFNLKRKWFKYLSVQVLLFMRKV